MTKTDIEGTELRRDQLSMLDVLKEFAIICKENNITWWLDSGTLLGAARHGGFIPWDDDMDVMVAKKDYAKLRRILMKMKDSPYFYQCMQSDVEHVNTFGAFRKKEGRKLTTDRRSQYFRYGGLGMDVFTLDYSSKFSAHMSKFLYLNLQHPSQYIKTRWLRHFYIRTVEILNFLIFIPLCRLVGLINPKGQYHHQYASSFYKHPIYLRNIYPLTTLSFEGIECPVPGNWDAYLTDLYGDWHTPPSEDAIRRHLHNNTYLKDIFEVQSQKERKVGLSPL